MTERLFLGTRKGLIRLDKSSAGWTISKVDFLGDNVSMLLPDSREERLYAALNLGHFGAKLRRSDDGGENWTECAVPVYPEGAIVGPPPFPGPDGKLPDPKPASLSEIWSLETGGADQPGLLWCGTIPGGLFRSTDYGDTWELVSSLWDRPERSQWFGGGKDDPGIHSIYVDPRNSARVLVAVSCGGVWLTEDGGATWTCKADGMRAEYMPPDRAYDPVIQDAHRMMPCPAEPDHLWVQHHNGIFRSVDGAESWQEIQDVKPSAFGLGVAVHPTDPLTAWFVPAVKDECRVPVDQQLVVTRTRDGGQSFDILRDGLPQQDCFDIVFRHCLEVDETGERLAMGTSTGGLWISENGGDSWEHISSCLPQIYCVRFG
ncbi:MAG: exo-alpha-sialidase [Planctomycetaceae bacterium]